jgi:hypothetical protein
MQNRTLRGRTRRTKTYQGQIMLRNRNAELNITLSTKGFAGPEDQNMSHQAPKRFINDQQGAEISTGTNINH